MSKLNSQQEYFFQLCQQVVEPEVICKFMFGGPCLYLNSKIFAIIDQDKLWLRKNQNNQDQFARLGLEQYIYTSKNNSTSMKMRYFAVPLEILENLEQFKIWLNTASKY